jgi:hypothetical protein
VGHSLFQRQKIRSPVIYRGFFIFALRFRLSDFFCSLTCSSAVASTQVSALWLRIIFGKKILSGKIAQNRRVVNDRLRIKQRESAE